VPRWEPVRKAAEAAVRALSGVQSVMVALTAEKAAGAPAPRREPAAPAPGAHGGTRPAQLPPGVKSIIAVASGKGGVGKSTTAVNLALGLLDLGLSVGMLDADIYGPSVPKLLGISGKPQLVGNRTLLPMEGYGLKVMSIGFLVEEETPMIWRGPMVMSALTQMLREVEWGTLDIMVVDMPPGTGDAQLTMAQQVPLAGAIIVSTPQDLALIDARRGIAMFGRVNVPVLGIVENMSTFICPKCGTRSDIFGHGGARREAERLRVPFLGEVPLDMAIRETSDAGRPVVATDPKGPHAAAYRAIAVAVREQLGARGPGRSAPKIVIEA
jgi:ATP-binding protein involved in chromosome partitioning